MEPLRHVQPGDPMVSANAFNCIIDAARDYRDRTKTYDGGKKFDPEIPVRLRVYNPTETDWPPFTPVALDGPAFIDPDTRVEQMLNDGIVVKAKTDGPGMLMVTIQPIPAGGVGRAVIQGITGCDVEILDAGHEFASLNDDGKLESTEFGTTRILHKDGDSEKQWCLLWLGAIEDRSYRTGILQETFTENATETGRARVKLHVADYENSNEENGLKTKLGEEEVTAYCSKAKDGDTIESGTRVDLWFVNNRWDIVNANCEPG